MNYLTVQVSKVPGPMVTVTLEEGATIADALNNADVAFETGYEIRMNNDVASLDTEVTNNAIIILTKMIKGN